ncbi:MAG: VacJ family lipoprotein [Rhodoferax sp.]|nr:VacJ family lipoprotein [Rhodoferax sp.]
MKFPGLSGQLPLLRLRGWMVLPTLLLALLLQGCATVRNPDPRDPLESLNRSVFSFNEAVDRAVLKPVAKGYQAITPDFVRTGIGNFFSNLADVWSAVNNGLQGRGQEVGDSVGRVMVNSSIGILGLLDVASDLNIERHPANFGQTLGRWGVPPGPFLVLPLFGPYTLREIAALPVDVQGDLKNRLGDQNVNLVLPILNVINLRSKYLNTGDVIQGASLDSYLFQRDAYLQRQRNIQYDGNPPDEAYDANDANDANDDQKP